MKKYALGIKKYYRLKKICFEKWKYNYQLKKKIGSCFIKIPQAIRGKNNLVPEKHFALEWKNALIYEKCF